jgi:hypothetical protein
VALSTARAWASGDSFSLSTLGVSLGAQAA